MEHCLYGIDDFTGSFIVGPAYSSITDFYEYIWEGFPPQGLSEARWVERLTGFFY